MVFHRDKNHAICYRNKFYTNTYKDDLVDYIIFRLLASVRPVPTDLSDLLKEFRSDTIDISAYVFTNFKLPDSLLEAKRKLESGEFRKDTYALKANEILKTLTNNYGIGRKLTRTDGKALRGKYIEESFEDFRDQQS